MAAWRLFHLFATLIREKILTLEEKFHISTLPCNILYVLTMSKIDKYTKTT